MKINGLDLLPQCGLTPLDIVILGSAACIIHGMPGTNGDLDVLVGEDYDGPETCGILDLGRDLCGGRFDSNTIFNNSVVIDGVRVMSIGDLREFYTYLVAEFGKGKHVKTLDWLMQVAD